jgi:DNA invertase Pin-like site-specific DNA recombinase|tara:strand:- start:178 stop:381 length:204 start_codon:yes stop_codon:yes gene_type:complete
MGKIKREDRKDRRGGGYAKRKFTYEQAELIREIYAAGVYTQSDLAEVCEVSQPIINQILTYKTYTKD